MVRPALALVLVALGCSWYCSPAGAQEWARKMFKESTHDFGTVARGAKVEHRFKITNLYKEDIHIAGVRASCSCTTPSITKQTLKTWETGEVVATFNTRTHQGYRSATLTVTIDKPYYAEVQLQVSGNIRTDIVVHPGFVDFGSVDAGTVAEKKVSVLHAGRPDWQIVDVLSANSNFEVEVLEAKRNGPEVTYQMLVRLKESATPGYIKEQLMLVTNDSRAPQFPVDVEGRVTPSLTISPTSLVLGSVAPGEQVTKTVVIRGKAPFRVNAIECDNPDFTFQKNDDAREIQVVRVTYTGSQQGARVSQRIRFVTDVGQGTVQEITAQAQVIGSSASAAPETAAAVLSPKG